MSRRRSKSSWLHRWSRPLIGAIAVLGATNTGYLTTTKLFGAEAACPTSGCEQVLSSPYATVFGQPLALFGLLAYIAMAIFALAPLAINPDNKEFGTKIEDWTWFLLFAGSTAMLLFSSYLMYIMVTKFVVPNGLEALCLYCIASAIFATALFLLTVLGRVWNDVGQLFFSGIIVAMVTLTATLAIYSPIGRPVADAYNITSATGDVAFSVTESSGPAEIELAKHLKETGAKMYGAYWCSHCYEQKRLFGVAAIAEMPYIECDAKGKDSQTALCQEVFTKVEQQTGRKAGFPTWEIEGQYYPGQLPLEDLAQYSGYEGPKDFQN